MNKRDAQTYVHGMITGHHNKATSNHYNDVAKAVDDIYTEFNEEIVENARYYEDMIDDIEKEHETSTCNNCKHLNMTKFHANEGGGDMYIPCDVVYVETTGAVTLQEFGCNKFERGLS